MDKQASSICSKTITTQQSFAFSICLKKHNSFTFAVVCSSCILNTLLQKKQHPDREAPRTVLKLLPGMLVRRVTCFSSIGLSFIHNMCVNFTRDQDNRLLLNKKLPINDRKNIIHSFFSLKCYLSRLVETFVDSIRRIHFLLRVNSSSICSSHTRKRHTASSVDDHK